MRLTPRPLREKEELLCRSSRVAVALLETLEAPRAQARQVRLGTRRREAQAAAVEASRTAAQESGRQEEQAVPLEAVEAEEPLEVERTQEVLEELEARELSTSGHGEVS